MKKADILVGGKITMNECIHPRYVEDMDENIVLISEEP
jgi:hypothetical protein